MNGLRCPIRSEIHPVQMRSTDAVHSATPSMTPRLATDAPSVAVMKSGSTGMIISLEMSVSSETTPSATTFAGRSRFAPFSGGNGASCGAGVLTRASLAQRPRRPAARQGDSTAWIVPSPASAAFAESGCETTRMRRSSTLKYDLSARRTSVIWTAFTFSS